LQTKDHDNGGGYGIGRCQCAISIFIFWAKIVRPSLKIKFNDRVTAQVQAPFSLLYRLLGTGLLSDIILFFA